MNRASFALLVVLGSSAMWTTSQSLSAAAEDYGVVELIRDRWGVPHVMADSDAGAMFGLGYATAEDRGFQMHYTLRIMQGRLAELIGDVKKVRRNETAVQNDRKMRTFGFARAAKALAGNLDRESVALLEAYSDGVNEYFQRNRGKLHGLYAKVGLAPEPWTPADCIVSWWHLAQFFATDGTRDLLRYRNLTEGPPPDRRAAAVRGGRGGTTRGGRGAPTRQPATLKQLLPDESTAVVQREDVTDAWIERTRAFLQQHGFKTESRTNVEGDSPIFAAGELGESPGRVLAVEGDSPIFAARKLGESPGRVLAVEGDSPIFAARKLGESPGTPKFSHAWVVGGKATGTGAAVLVSEPRTPVANPSLLYEFHICGKTFNARGVGVAGSPVILIGFNRHVAWGMTALGADQADLFRLKTDPEHPDQYEFDGIWRPMQSIREQIKVKGGRPQSLVIRQTHLGPVVNEFAFARRDDPPVALRRIPICETDRETIQGAVAMLRAKDVHEFHAALADWRFPSANVVFGDRQGNIGFSLVGALPLRSPLAPEGGGAAQDGSSSRYGWRAIVPHALVPHVINPKRGYLFSANHRPIGSFYPISLGISTGSLGDTLRSWRLRELLGAKRALTPQYMMEVRDDATNPARREIVRIGLHLRNVLQSELSPEADLALERLEPWYRQGASSNLEVPGAELAMELNTFFRFLRTDLALIYGGGESGLSYFLKTVGRRLDADPKAEIRPLEREFIDSALRDAWLSAQRKYRDEPEQWLARAQAQVAARKLGYFQSLDDFPSLDERYDLSCPSLPCIDGGTIRSQSGQAYSQWVPLHDVDAALSILPPGSSERPESASRTVNTRAWAVGQLHPAPLSRTAVERHAVARHVLCKPSDG